MMKSGSGNLLFKGEKRLYDRFLPSVRVVTLVEGIDKQREMERQLKRHRTTLLQTGELWEIYQPIHQFDNPLCTRITTREV